ncbi:MAG: DNA repair protein RecO [Gemmatimonadales bacterium]
MPGAPVLTPAIVLRTLRYGETSRVVRLATADQGVLSAIAKGALRPRSRFGGTLQLLSEGQAHLHLSRSSDLHLLVAFDLVSPHTTLGADLERFAAATALAELAARFVPSAPNPELYTVLRDDLALIEAVPREGVVVVSLRALWRLMTQLGIGPTLESCARDGAPLPPGGASLSLRDGGFLCSGCARGAMATRLTARDREDLVALVTEGAPVPILDEKQERAHRRLLLRWVREHLAETSLPAMEAWASARAA